MNTSFSLKPHEQAQFDMWRAKHPCERKYQGAIGGALTFSFSPTSIGTAVKVSCSMCKEEVDLTDYEMW